MVSSSPDWGRRCTPRTDSSKEDSPSYNASDDEDMAGLAIELSNVEGADNRCSEFYQTLMICAHC